MSLRNPEVGSMWHFDGHYQREGLIRGCLKKKRYRTETHAQEVAKKAQLLRGTPLTVYQCKYCGGYHLTHTIQRG